MSSSDRTISQLPSGRARSLALNGSASELHPAWQQFIGFCQDLQYGEIERLSIQDGMPVLAEQVKKKVKFTK